VKYSVIIFNHNQWNDVHECIARWKLSTIKPTSIYISDDGSDTIDNTVDATVISFKRTMNISKMTNDIVDKIDTDYFFKVGSHLYPSSHYVENCLFLYKKNVMLTPYMLKVDSYKYDFDNVFQPPLLTITNDPFLYSISVQLFHKDSFIYMNEAFYGYGYEDVDYNIRWTGLGNSFGRMANNIIYYVKHDTSMHGNEFYDRIHINKKLSDRLYSYYKFAGIPDIKKLRYFIPPEDFK